MPVIAESITRLPIPQPTNAEAWPTAWRYRRSRLRLLLLMLLAALLVSDAEAARNRRRTSRPRSRPVLHQRVRPPRPVASPVESKPKEKLVPFRDLANGTEFFHPADRDRKLRPLRKVSATHARSLLPTTGASEELVAIPGELGVIPKKPAAGETVRKKASRRR